MMTCLEEGGSTVMQMYGIISSEIMGMLYKYMKVTFAY